MTKKVGLYAALMTELFAAKYKDGATSVRFTREELLDTGRKKRWQRETVRAMFFVREEGRGIREGERRWSLHGWGHSVLSWPLVRMPR